MASNTAPSTFSPQMQNRILRSYSAAESPWKTAVMAGYEGARQNKSFNSPTRVGSNPNSSIAQLQRSRLSLQGEEIVKNTAFGRNLINRRRAYCSSGISWHPDTRDSALNRLVTDYCNDQWKRMGVNQSMQQAFGICADAMLPQYGDCALRWIRSDPGNPKSELRLLAITGDRIGEIYRYVAPVTKDGKTYYCGLFFDGPNIVSYRIYERWYDTTYTRPENVDAADVIFFIDPIDTGVRGVSLFSAAVDDIRSSHEILKATKDTMQQQSKMAAIASNNSGSAMDYSYDQQTNSDGRIEYQESYADGAVVKYQFNGDSYQVLRAEHPSQDFVAALRYLDQRGSLACGFPYEFLFSGSESGGAPFRGAFEIAGREIERLRNQVHRPRLDVIAYVTIMDGVERGLLPAKAGITRGNWQFTTLPSADAFRDAKSDIDQIRAGITSPQRVIANNLGTTADAILSETREWAILVSKTVEDANRELVKQGYKPTVTAADVAQVSDNPQQAAQAENLLGGKPTTISDSSTKSDTVEKTSAAPKPAALADFDESKHPRAKDGEFGSGGGGAKKEDAPKNEATAKTGDKHRDAEHASDEAHASSRWADAQSDRARESKKEEDYADAASRHEKAAGLHREAGKQGDAASFPDSHIHHDQADLHDKVAKSMRDKAAASPKKEDAPKNEAAAKTGESKAKTGAPWKDTLHRGVREKEARTDAGDYGSNATYWSGDESRADAYAKPVVGTKGKTGSVIKSEVSLENPLVFQTTEEARAFRRSIVGDKLLDNPHSQQAADLMEKAIRKKGHDGVVVYDSNSNYTALPDRPFEVVVYHKSETAALAEWDESKHPRAKDGEFGPGGGGAKKSQTAPSGKTSIGGHTHALQANEITGEHADLKRSVFNAASSAADEIAKARPDLGGYAQRKIGALNPDSPLKSFMQAAEDISALGEHAKNGTDIYGDPIAKKEDAPAKKESASPNETGGKGGEKALHENGESAGEITYASGHKGTFKGPLGEKIFHALRAGEAPPKEVHHYGSQVVSSFYSKDSANRAAQLLQKSGFKLRGITESLDEPADAPVGGLVKGNKVWRVFVTTQKPDTAKLS